MLNPFEINTNIGGQGKSKSLDWDESAADTVKTIDDVHDTERAYKNFFFLRFLLLLVFIIFASRLFYLQIVRGEYFREMAENNRIRSRIVEAPRGLIFDRLQKPLLENIASFNLVAVPFDLPKGDIRALVEKLTLVLGLETDEVLNKLKNINKNSIASVIIKQDISHEQALLFETRASEFVGFSVEQAPIRHYFDPQIFSSVLGYTGQANNEDIERLKLSQVESFSQVGKQGIEILYEEYLRGITGENQVEVDASGKIIKVLGEKASNPGKTLILNLDGELQKKIYEQLTKNNKNIKAAAVAINPKTGEVLALLSVPSVDNNQFAHGLSQAEYQKIISDPLKPFLNRAIAGQYPPGSTVKPIVAAAALNEGLVTEHTIIVDKGVLVIPNQFDPEIAYNFYGWKLTGLGPMNVKSAIAQSSDIYFYTVAGGHPNSNIPGLGAEKLAEYYRKFNLGKNTGIDLPGEKPGIVADPAWKEKAFANDPIMKKWYLGDTYHIGIGQGDMLATPLQVTEWTSVVANNGIGMKPKVLNRVVDSEGKTVMQNSPEILVEKFLPDDILKIVQAGMRENITNGSGRLLNSLPITSGGKTGTSQFDGSDPKKTHAWFTAYAPFEDPQIAITVLVEAGGEGHAVAVPVVNEALKWWAKNRYGK